MACPEHNETLLPLFLGWALPADFRVLIEGQPFVSIAGREPLP